MLPETLTRALRGAVGAEILGAHRVSGGDINQAARVDTAEGPLFVKWNAAAPDAMFAREATSLERMRASGTPLRIPRVIGWDDDAQPAWLALEWLEPGRRRVADFDAQLGRGLAALHRASSERGFGFERTTWCGTTPQPNPWTEDWIAFYRDQRLGHQVELARERRGVPADAMRDFERLFERLPALLDASQPPSLIHGDLWSGNLHVCDDGRPGLIDPAAYYAHREAELGMMSLFGGFSSRVYDAYHEAWPLPAGWRERLPLYELYHVLNHYNLFGGGYGAQAFAIARRWGRA